MGRLGVNSANQNFIKMDKDVHCALIGCFNALSVQGQRHVHSAQMCS